ncbi:MAG: SRPBCC family protein [Pseudomonadota bacterium]
MRPVVITAVITICAPRPNVFQTATDMRAADFVRPRFPLPGISATDGGPWRRIGDRRHHVLTDESSVDEELTAHARDEAFAYRVTGFEGVFGRIVSKATAEWRFDWRGPELTQVEWTYSFSPRSEGGRVPLAIIAKLFWPGYLRAALRCVKEQAESQK